jgi:hypothetical protein
VAYQSKGGLVDWLSWLLFAGTARVVSDVRFQSYRREVRGSRAGYGLMVRRPPLGYSVPAQFAGTDDDNWFDRAFAPLGDVLLEAMIKEVGANL